MLYILKNIWAGKANKPIVANFFSLSFLQATNYVLPLVVFPYLIRILGVEKYGLVNFSQAFVNYFVVLTDYGFNLSATRDVSIYREDKDKVAAIFHSVITTKLFLTLISLVLVGAIVASFALFRNEALLYLLSFSVVVGQALMPTWFFLGVEKMKYITYANLIGKLIYTLLIFGFINTADDYIWVNACLGVSNLIASLVGLYFVYKSFYISVRLTSPGNVWKELKNSWNLFVSGFAINISISSNLFILGLFANATAVGFYSIAEKLFLVLRTIAALLYQIVYPQVCQLASQSFEALASFLRKITKVVLVIFVPAGVFLFVFSDYIIYLVAGRFIEESAFYLKILCFAPLFAALDIPACQTMLAYHLNRSYAAISIGGAVINIILNFSLAPFLFGTGTAVSSLATEVFIAVALYWTLHYRYPQYTFLKNISYNVKK